MSEERRLLPERRGMVSGGSLQVMRRRSSSSPSNGTNFHLEPFGTRQALVLARPAGVRVGHPPPPCCLLGRGRDKHQWGRFTARSQPVFQVGAEEFRWCNHLVGGEWWERDTQRVSQPLDCFPALCPSWQKVRVKVPPHACPCMKSLQQLSSAQRGFITP